MFRDLSLKLKLPIYLSAVLGTVIVVLSVAAYREVRVAQVRAAAERLQRVSQQLADLSDLGFSARIAEIQALSEDSSVVRLLQGSDDASVRAAARAALEEVAAASQVAGVQVRDARGVPLLGVGDVRGLHAETVGLMVAARSFGPMRDVGGRSRYVATAAVRSGGELLGGVSLWRTMEVDAQTRGFLGDLIGMDAAILIGGGGGLWTDLANPVAERSIPIGLDDDVADGTLLWYERDEVGAVYAIVRRLENAPWYLVVELPRETVLAGARDFLLRLLLLIPIALAIVAGSAWFIGRAITQSLRETAVAAEAIAAGESGHRVEVRGGDEVGRLAVSFNTMAQRVEDSQNALRELNESLSRSNAELENFAYVASHDLREPLRMVRSFTQLLADRYSGQLDDDADKYIHFAVDGATRMEGLIRALLEYSRLDGKHVEPSVASGEAILHEALSILGPGLEEAGAEVTHDPLPDIVVDPDQVLRVFQNLLSNAVKFRGEAPPRVHVSSRASGDFHVFSVRDNGIGIDPRYFNRIFEIFKRLHGVSEFAGTGMGLSISKKIVERHGGRLWVESAPGEGSTFHFSLPRSAAMVA